MIGKGTVIGAAAVFISAMLPAAGADSAPPAAVFPDRQQLSAPAQRSAGVRAAASGDAGTVVAAWTSPAGAAPPVVARVYRHGEWGAPAELATASPAAGDVDVAVSRDGSSAVAVWEQGGGEEAVVLASTWSAGGWSLPAPLSGAHAHHPRVVLSDGGAAVTVWDRYSANGWIVEAVSGSPGGWSKPAALSAASGAAGRPEVSLSADGATGVAVWQEQNDATAPGSAIVASVRSGGGWSHPVDVARSSAPPLDPGPQVAVSADGSTAQAVWTGVDGVAAVRSSRWTRGGGWGAVETLSGTDNGTAGHSVAAAADGAVVRVAFSSQSDGMFRVRTRAWESGGWGPVSFLSDPERPAVRPDLAMSDNGRDGLAVWTEGQPGAERIRAAALRNGAWRPAADISDTGGLLQGRSVVSASGRTGAVLWAPVPRSLWSQSTHGEAEAVHGTRLITAPDPPSLPSASTDGGALMVAWQQPAATGVPVLSYTATAVPGGGSCTTTALSCAIRGLRGGRSYRVRVVATNSAGASEPARLPQRVTVAQQATAAQTVRRPPRTVRVGTRKSLPRTTAQRVAVSWSSRTPRKCRVKRMRVVGRKAGVCRVRAKAPATPGLLSLRATFTVRVVAAPKRKKVSARPGRADRPKRG